MVNFVRMRNLNDLKELLWSDGPTVLLIAGGTDLLVQQRRFEQDRMLVDISRLPELGGIGLDPDGLIRIGAGVSHQEVADHPLIQRQARILSLACAAVGSLQIRNRGTLGGNLGNASPAGDSLPALLCLEAQVCLASRDGSRRMPLAQFMTGPGKTARGSDEVIESVRFAPRQGRTLTFFKKAGQRKGMCCSKASVAFVGRRNSDGSLSQVRVALGAVGPTVLSVPRAEHELEGKLLEPDRIRAAAAACEQAASPIDDIRSTAVYRSKIVGAMLFEGLSAGLDHMNEMAERRKSRQRKRSRRPGRK